MEKLVACVGGGQLAQMLGQAGKKIDVKIRSASLPGSCAFSDCESFTSNLDVDSNFKEFIKDVNVFTFESEHEGLDWVEKLVNEKIEIHPNPAFVKIAGDRFLEKSYLAKLSIPTAPFELIDPNMSLEDLEMYLRETIRSKQLSPYGAVVKTRHGGYDGKGQWVLKDAKDADFTNGAKEIFKSISQPGCIIEGLVDFSIECSVIAARSIDGDFACWPLSHNEHQDSILRFSYSPITVVDNLEDLEVQATFIAEKLCESSNYVGTIAVECFVTKDGLVVNEIAPRVHNSGHWTIEGSKTSQFEQHLRAITGMELGNVECPGYSAMVNLVGVEIKKEAFVDLDGTFLHWYGKDVKKNRKVGHITVIGKNKTELDLRLNTLIDVLEKNSIYV